MVAVAEEPRYRGKRHAGPNDACHGGARKKNFPKKPKGLETRRWTSGWRWDVEGVSGPRAEGGRPCAG